MHSFHVHMQFEGGKIVNIGWTASERLISVFEDGTIVVHSLQGERLYTSPLARVSERNMMFT